MTCPIRLQLMILNRMYSLTNPLPERIIWLVFECLARGLCILLHGNENLDPSPSWDQGIGHFDIKPGNILVGGRDSQHPGPGVFKLADFSGAQKVERSQSQQYITMFRAGGTKEWQPPEVWDPQCPGRKFGSPSNVWQVAKCMHELVRVGRSFDIREAFWCHVQGNVMQSFGRDLLLGDVHSDKVRQLVVWCLAREPR
jgi:serine/threonine protein kinase